MNISPELLSILLPAFLAGVIILSTHVILGQQVLKRGIVFIDLAIAQVAALGVVLSHWLFNDSERVFLAITPAALSIIASLLIAWLSRHHKKELEAMIGCLYVLAAATVLLVLSNDPHGAEQVAHSLSGRILWLNYEDLLYPAVISAGVLITTILCPSCLTGWLFYPIFALTVTISVDLAGVYLVFSTLIMPAMANSQSNHRLPAFCLGLLGYAGGLLLASSLDLPGGSSIVISLASLCLAYRLCQSIFQGAKNTQQSSQYT